MKLDNVIILLLILFVISLYLSNMQNKENFSLGIINPYSYQLHKVASEKACRWREAGRPQFYEHRYYVPQFHKEKLDLKRLIIN